MHKCLDFNSMWFYLLNKDVGEFYKETSPHNILKPAAWLIHIKGITNFISIAIRKKFKKKCYPFSFSALHGFNLLDSIHEESPRMDHLKCCTGKIGHKEISWKKNSMLMTLLNVTDNEFSFYFHWCHSTYLSCLIQDVNFELLRTI